MERTAVSTFETDKRQIYIVGGGIAGLSAAVFAIRDGHIPGNNVHIFETTNVMGGALDGTGSADTCRIENRRIDSWFAPSFFKRANWTAPGPCGRTS